MTKHYVNDGTFLISETDEIFNLVNVINLIKIDFNLLVYVNMIVLVNHINIY